MPKAKSRQRFRNDLGEVRSCGCGGINMTMGPLTLHYAADEMRALQELVDSALAIVEGASDDSKATARRGKHHAQGPLH